MNTPQGTNTPSPVPGLSGLTVLARGGYSTVYRARQDSVGREVALKIDTRTLDDERDRRRFLREASTAGRMSSHPYIVDVYDAGVTSDNHPYLVMELCPGGSYAQKLKEVGRVSPAETRDVGAKIADALAAAHHAGILHRDVKPGNILISEYGHPLLADFGLAALPDPNRELSVTLEALTPAYAPPEVFRMERPTPACDVYALGATLYALLAGRPPRWPEVGQPSLATMVRLHEEPIPDLPGVPRGLVEVLRQAMAAEAVDRFPTAIAMRDALAAVSLDPSTIPTEDEIAAGAAGLAGAAAGGAVATGVSSGAPQSPAAPSAAAPQSPPAPVTSPAGPTAPGSPPAPTYTVPPTGPPSAPPPSFDKPAAAHHDPTAPMSGGPAAGAPTSGAPGAPTSDGGYNATRQFSDAFGHEPLPPGATSHLGHPPTSRFGHEATSAMPPGTVDPTAGFPHTPTSTPTSPASPSSAPPTTQPTSGPPTSGPPTTGTPSGPPTTGSPSGPYPGYPGGHGPAAAFGHGAQPRPGHPGAPVGYPAGQPYGAPSYPPGMPPRRSRKGLLIGGIAAAVVLVLALGGLAFASGLIGKPDPNPSGAQGQKPSPTPEPSFVGKDCQILLPFPGIEEANPQCPAQPECFGPINVDGGKAKAKSVACNRKHSWETYLTAELPQNVPSNKYQDVKSLGIVNTLCGPLGLSLVSKDNRGWKIDVLPPSDKAFENGDRRFRCVAGKGQQDRPSFVDS